jgi:hypothetical protein
LGIVLVLDALAFCTGKDPSPATILFRSFDCKKIHVLEGEGDDEHEDDP